MKCIHETIINGQLMCKLGKKVCGSSEGHWTKIPVLCESRKCIEIESSLKSTAQITFGQFCKKGGIPLGDGGYLISIKRKGLV